MKKNDFILCSIVYEPPSHLRDRGGGCTLVGRNTLLKKCFVRVRGDIVIIMFSSDNVQDLVITIYSSDSVEGSGDYCICQ